MFIILLNKFFNRFDKTKQFIKLDFINIVLCNEASTWSSYVIKLSNSYIWRHHPQGWHDATKSLPTFLLLPLGLK